MRRPLSEGEMEVQGLTELYDAAWGERELKDASQALTKKKRGR